MNPRILEESELPVELPKLKEEDKEKENQLANIALKHNDDNIILYSMNVCIFMLY